MTIESAVSDRDHDDSSLVKIDRLLGNILIINDAHIWFLLQAPIKFFSRMIKPFF